MALTALVLGSGFAGQGHATALRTCGVDVVAMAGRTGPVVERVAADMDIPFATTDWQHALSSIRPDIVAVGTPGGAHYEPVMAALAGGAHVFCDKPLAPTAGQAREICAAADRAGVRTAYAASFRYMPHVLLAREMVANGDIGRPLEVEAISHFGLNPLIPFGWSHELARGGGRLNNNFTHKLAIVLSVLDGRVSAVSGTTRSDLDRAPLVAGVHHFRERADHVPDDLDDPDLRWAESDADWSYTVLARISAGEWSEPVSALFKHSGLQHRFHSDHLVFYGSEGAILIEGHYGHGPLWARRSGDGWTEVAVPRHIADRQPEIDDATQRNWTILAQAFVADVRGESVAPYPTFHDGWLHQEIIDIVRTEAGWIDVPDRLPS